MWSVCWCQARAELGLWVAGTGATRTAERLCPGLSLWALETPRLRVSWGMLAPPCAEALLFSGVTRAPCAQDHCTTRQLSAFPWWVSKVQKLKMWGKEEERGVKKRRQAHAHLPHFGSWALCACHMQPVDPDSKAGLQGLLRAGPWLWDVTGSWSLSFSSSSQSGGAGVGGQDTETFSAHSTSCSCGHRALGEPTKMTYIGLKDFFKLTGRYVIVPLFI